ncbi:MULTISPECIES: hypothetical protein [unclassified Bradyrhizobium]|uniref:hypothetical protein n=1 Tax=unclassified Bradyrhizobium TaxID=2631580 RepID=UPI0024E04C1C|nr:MULTISPECIES: hypothetical protein [unclassified Bradyrhizobium]
MSRRRKRTSPTSSLRERLLEFAAQAHAAAKELPAGTARRDLLKKASAGATAEEMDRFLSRSDDVRAQQPVGPSRSGPVPRQPRRQGDDPSFTEHEPLHRQRHRTQQEH